jgi:hypothetical protein
MDYADYDIAAYEIAENVTSEAETALSPFKWPVRAITPGRRNAVVAVVEDGISMSRQIWEICEFLDIAVVRVPGHCDLGAVLRGRTPMAVVCELDGVGQDGCHVMKTVASHDPSLPVLMVAGDDPALWGAADAVEEIWRLTEVTMLEVLPSVAGMVDFLFHAGRKGNCMRLMPAHG